MGFSPQSKLNHKGAVVAERSLIWGDQLIAGLCKRLTGAQTDNQVALVWLRTLPARSDHLQLSWERMK